jgi:1,2-dihydroxy-3-keto-5-methylthiopentene dioxygenase
MAVLSIPSKNIEINVVADIHSFLKSRGVVFDQWVCDINFDDSASQEEILEAYAKDLVPFMNNSVYKTADVISINAGTENYAELRAKFLAEHTHSEDEIRFFVDGKGLFWFNFDNEPVFNLLCEAGDLISVPAGTKHWFDAGEKNPFVKAIRIFMDHSAWVPNYTNSSIELDFLNFKMPNCED